MRRPNRKYIRIGGIVLSILVLIIITGVIIAYNKRQGLLEKAISKATAKALHDYNLDVKLGDAHFSGLNTVTFSSITIVPQQRDSLLTVKNLSVSVKIAPLVLGNVELSDVKLDAGHLNLTEKNGVKNFDFLFKKKKDTTAKTSADLSALANNLVNQIFYKIPDNLDIKNFLVTFTRDSAQMKLLAQKVTIAHGQLMSTIKVGDNDTTWHVAGKMRPSDKDIDVRLYADHGKVQLPFVEKRYHMKVAFDTVTTKLVKVEHGDGLTKMYGYWGVRNLVINQPRLSSSDIVVPTASVNANVFVGKNYVSIDSSSLVHLGKISFTPYFKYQLKPVKIFTVKVHTDWMNAQDVLNSLPGGTFENFEGMQVAGKLNYRMHVFLDMSNPDQVQFESFLDKSPDFRILKYGKLDMTRLNQPFVYTPYEDGKPMPSHLIGPANPEFTPIDQISPNLRNAVMTAEDPSFYTHHGFVVESFRRSLATDIKKHQFKRGGSTISMQLVKNAFLSREKTLTRKVEEIFIVWMIEQNHLMTKDRMLEVYFNIIEWGRGIYGIDEASHYYFGKSPSELTVGESIYLASIVPHPKTGLYSFQSDGTLRPSLHGYFNLIGNLMANRGLTEPDSNAYGMYGVRLKESLREKIAPYLPAVADSVIKQQQREDDNDAGVGVAPPTPVPAAEPEKKPGFFQRLFGGGKKDTVAKKTEEFQVDTAGKTKKQIRQEKRALRRQEKQRQQELKQEGLQ